MFKLSPLSYRANWIYDKIPWQEVIQLTAQDQLIDGRHLKVHDSSVVHFGNVSYLGLETDVRLQNAAIQAILRYGIQFSSSRAYVQIPLYEELESLLEQIFGQPVVVSASTTLGHMAVMPAFMHPTDAVLVDYQAHASMQLTLQIIKAQGVHYELLTQHNDYDLLESRVRELSAKHERVWYVADGIYSMFGDTVQSDPLNDIMSRYENLYAYIDDAHGMSWTGTHGSGFVHDRFPAMRDRVMLLTSMAKGFASTGGIIVCPNMEVKNWLRRAGSTLIFSGPLHASSLAAAVESAKIHLSPEIEFRQKKVMDNIQHFVSEAKRRDVFLADDSETPIFFAGVGKITAGAALCQKLREQGMYTNLGIYPAVGLNQTGIRISIHHHLEKEDISRLVQAIGDLLPEVWEEAHATREQVEQAFAKRQAPKENALLAMLHEEATLAG